MGLAAGTRIGPYEVTDKLGEGGMGEVYKARDTRLDRTVAIKIVRTDFSERFEREAKSISALNHPHICTLHDVGRTGEFAYLVMEYVDGAPVSGPLPIDDVLKLGAQICDALHAAHQKGIVHRDLKPANILTSRAGIKLLDFGLAKPRVTPSQTSEQATVAALTGAHTVVGTPQYMAPEQIEGREVDVRTDVFALGCVLYELTTGKRAFEGKTVSNVMAAILATEPRKPSDLAPVTPPILEWIILRCLEKDPEARWQSAHDIGLQLQLLAQHRATLPSLGKVTRPALRVYAGGVASGLLLAATAGGLWWLLASGTTPGAVPESAGQTALVVSLPATVTLEDASNGSAIALSPDGRRLAFVATTGTGPSAIYLRQLDQFDSVKVAGTDNAGGPFFSPNGQWIAFTDGQRLKKVPVGGGVAVDICDAPEMRGSVWLADDTIVFSPTTTGGLMRVSAQGGTPTVLTKLDPAQHEKTHRMLVALPGGASVVFVIGSDEIGTYDDGRIVALTLASGKITELAKGYAPAYSPTGHLLYVRNQTLFAVPLDPVTLKVGGSPVQILKDVASRPEYGIAEFAIAATGDAAFVLGGDRTLRADVRWIDRLGRIETIPIDDGSYIGLQVSPDGRRLGLVRGGANNSLWTYDLERKQTSRVTFRFDVERAAWSHDSRRVTYWSGIDLRSMAADGSGAEEILVPASETNGRSLHPVAWSSDGQVLALSSYMLGRSFDVAVRRNGKIVPIVESRFNERPTSLTPDGRWLAYVSDETGRDELYVRDLSGAGAKYGVAGGGADDGWFTKQGRELLSVGPKGVFATFFTPGTPPIFGRPERLLTQAKEADFAAVVSAAPAPDGSRVAAIFSKPARPLTEIRVVANWAQQLAVHWRR
jgi:Tol biopolymer transport system component/tRNA A-37 threonylcarbamoyl transferase component Bud32